MSQLIKSQAVLDDKAYDTDERMLPKLQAKNVQVVSSIKKKRIK